ncbi:hypothetical protein BDA99DRAFT_539045 [Phascolomyces articulosus]|uniref:Uncharacterized protein n=1 Tax=Phascolomyces articulosus TaxID=60185 RepID=A0AAD5K9V8_9FUNG|nr:hypothetical protein BDA99DRAFT_539045 [Phascolomyces articulosus]
MYMVVFDDVWIVYSQRRIRFRSSKMNGVLYSIIFFSYVTGSGKRIDFDGKVQFMMDGVHPLQQASSFIEILNVKPRMYCPHKQCNSTTVQLSHMHRRLRNFHSIIDIPKLASLHKKRLFKTQSGKELSFDEESSNLLAKEDKIIVTKILRYQ